MFIPFLYVLRSHGLKVTTTEWFVLLEALEKGHADFSLDRFYVVCRAICCRSEYDYDTFDRGFAAFFDGIEIEPSQWQKELDEWLKQPIPRRVFSEEEKARMQQLDLETLDKMLKERLKEQKSKHDGGNKWIGTGGTSPFGYGGYHPSGIRIGGEGESNSAVQVAKARKFANLNKDLILDTRQIGLALRKLRNLGREGTKVELDIEASIAATASNAGEIDLVFHAQRQNQVKLLLLMDVGGSMTWYSQICSQLFSSVHQCAHFKAFQYYYFHNCPYDFLYTDIEQDQARNTLDVLNELDSSWYVIVVGDAAMSPYELTEIGGAVDYFYHNRESGLTWLQRIQTHFPISVWLNPEPESYWQRVSNHLIRRVFPHMYPLSVSGIEDAISKLQNLKQQKGF